ncbi:MAG: phenylalanine--tRNA ligase beta subunit-related protein [Candidatus Amulumruptor caecigallinarius]|nr:phenylalanine--tRNA ligase beta subunit-related protein [Candidatus Amulumruptor caecigallinarius]MCM1397666.1 phenylalanine--tRNA ligase beta subunit-related protein [Candidatus Amulumruptor caecigallinarius]MCM1454705.1 phenylalanine--tRNA ligase beta subunit-related protein [bacterium]
MELTIDPIYASVAPDYKVILLTADVEGGDTPAELTQAIERVGQGFVDVMEMADIAKRPGIAATRAVYKALGKEPNRYRPSHEQMMRRFLKGQGLYTVSALVDTGNLLSLLSGYSVGVFDAAAVKGDTLTVGVGLAGEPYEGIGRGPLNIEHLPVVRDAEGAIGTPTSDNERTKTSPATRRIVVTIHAFGPDMPVAETAELAAHLFTLYCGASNITTAIITANPA